MRTIKFRGKKTQQRFDNKLNKAVNDWLIGNLHVDVKDCAIYDLHNANYGEFVDCETVGQFTGLYDKNGMEIYEGDKLLMKDEIGNSGVVTVGFEHGGFIVFRGLAWRQIGDYDVEKNTIEVIGNIHEEEKLK